MNSLTVAKDLYNHMEDVEIKLQNLNGLLDYHNKTDRCLLDQIDNITDKLYYCLDTADTLINELTEQEQMIENTIDTQLNAVLSACDLYCYATDLQADEYKWETSRYGKDYILKMIKMIINEKWNCYTPQPRVLIDEQHISNADVFHYLLKLIKYDKEHNIIKSL